MATTGTTSSCGSSNKHTQNWLRVCLSAPGHFHAILAAFHDNDNAAWLRIPTLGMIFQATMAQTRATGIQGGAEDQTSSWSVISKTNIYYISADELSDCLW